MARINRRRFLKASGAAAVGAKMGIAGILASHHAPVFAQANTVHILRWNDFVPAADKVLREVFAPEVQKALGLKLNVETVNANDIPARATSSIQSGNGPDIIMILNNYPHLYSSAAVDVSARGRRGGQGAGRHLRRRDAAQPHRRQVGVDALVDGAGAASPTASRGSTRSAPRASRRPGRSTTTVGKKLKAAKRPHRPDARQHLRRRADLHLPAAVVLRRPGSRRQGQGGARLEGDAGVGALHDAVLEGRARRGRPGLGRLQQQPRVPVRRHQRVPERRVDLRRRAERRRQVQDREGRAAAHRHPARAAAGRARKASTATTPRSTTW